MSKVLAFHCSLLWLLASFYSLLSPWSIALEAGAFLPQSQLVILFDQFLSCLKFQHLTFPLKTLHFMPPFSFPLLGTTLSSSFIAVVSSLPPLGLFLVMHSSGETSDISSLLIPPPVSFLI